MCYHKNIYLTMCTAWSITVPENKLVTWLRIFIIFFLDQLNALRRIPFPRILCEIIDGLRTIQPRPLQKVLSRRNLRRPCSSYPRFDLSTFRDPQRTSFLLDNSQGRKTKWLKNFCSHKIKLQQQQYYFAYLSNKIVIKYKRAKTEQILQKKYINKTVKVYESTAIFNLQVENALT